MNTAPMADSEIEPEVKQGQKEHKEHKLLKNLPSWMKPVDAKEQPAPIYDQALRRDLFHHSKEGNEESFLQQQRKGSVGSIQHDAATSESRRSSLSKIGHSIVDSLKLEEVHAPVSRVQQSSSKSNMSLAV